MLALGRYLMPVFLTEDRMRTGLHQLVEYLHMNGVTAINEPVFIGDRAVGDVPRNSRRRRCAVLLNLHG